jgi:hypothetical protein
VAEGMYAQETTSAVQRSPASVQPTDLGHDWRLTARHNRDAAGQRVPRNRLGQIPRWAAGQTLRPSRVPAQLAAGGELRADSQAELSGTPFGALDKTSHMEARPVQPPAQQEGINGPAAPWPQPRVQPKLTVGQINDPLEDEADRAADRVMRMPASAATSDLDSAGQGIVQRTCSCEQRDDQQDTVQRQAAQPDPQGPQSPLDQGPDTEEDAIQQGLIQSYLQDTETVQRQAGPQEQTGPQEDDDETAAGEQILMQSKAAGAQPGPPNAEGLEPAVRSLEGGGQPLPTAIRHYMEPRFGHDFSSVRIHTDGRASDTARMANARAFTHGRNIAFASGEYAPTGSAESLRLLAHELTHVIQQGQAGGRIQRKIVVGGKDYAPSARYLTWLTANFGPAMREFVEDMHNGGSLPVYSFSSFEQMGFEVRTRAAAIKGIEDVHKGCCGYYSTADPPYLDSTYWDQVGGGVDFVPKSPLPTGKNASDAIEAIFAPGAHTRLECLSMTAAIEYRAMLKSIGPAKFNAQFPGGAGIEIVARPSFPLISGADKKFEVKAVASRSEILPGDWVYFKNFKDYTTRVVGGYWQGENAIALGGGMFRGFGVAAMSETDLNQELVNRYNNDATPILTKTVADLLADGGGLLLSPVIRPVMSKIAP